MMSMLLLGPLLLASFGLVVAYTQDALRDRIVSLPGAEYLTIPFNQFSGYLTIPGSKSDAGKKMHYWFVESMNSPAKDPLAFWTNGGPGCSGVGGMMTEHGPFRANANLSLELNEFAWNTVANMVFIESPAGVGFSYADEEADYTIGDAQTAIDNYNLIQAFLARFPEYANNDLYITSESYGGHYMPTLAKQIVDMNSAGGNSKLNFKGFAVGNPYTTTYSGTPAMMDTLWGHQLVAKPLHDKFVRVCKSDPVNVPLCAATAAEMFLSKGKLNPYALDYPVCTSDKLQRGSAQSLWQLNHQLKAFGIEPKSVNLRSVEEYEPCEDDYTDAYLNREDVKVALHVNPTIHWRSCTLKLTYNRTDSFWTSTAPIYNYLIDGGYGLKILVFSGDDDSICATIGTQSWIWGLGHTVQPRQEWQQYIVNGQTAGYLTQWTNTKLGFLTIHGAGHEVPTYKPDVALDMWKKYLAGDLTRQ